MDIAYLGIDIAKVKFDVALLRPDEKIRAKAFANTAGGHTELLTWLARQHAGPVHACLEATGTYGDAIAERLADAGLTVSVVNPAAIAAYSRSRLTRTKTDRTDARVSVCAGSAASRFRSCWRNALAPSQRLIGPSSANNTAAVASPIPGMVLSKLGTSGLRKALYFPALTAMRHNPILRAHRERLLARGKHRMVIVGAIMRKLVHLVYGVLKNGKAFDADYATGA